MPESSLEPSPEELRQSLALIQRVGGQEQRKPVAGWPWYRWAGAAAAALALLGVSLLALSQLIERNRSSAYLAQARQLLQTTYAPQSPNGLRLDLPFQSTAGLRDAAKEDALQRAESLFYKALGAREGLLEAHLGLGYIYLTRNRFSAAQEEFQKALEISGNDARAVLGRGVSRFEDGLASEDPTLRTHRLEGALADFERVLELDPISGEASFDRAQSLFQLGRHKEAQQEIEKFLLRDSGSVWAQKLRQLQKIMRMNRTATVEKDVGIAARSRDTQALESLARLVPYQMPEAMRTALKQTLGASGSPPGQDIPAAADLEWAARVMESAYGSATGDHSYSRLLEFYAGLSPPQRRTKKSLDDRFQQLVNLHLGGNLQAAISGSDSLVKDYELLHDHWQLVNVHHLRGNCFFYTRTDLTQALPEYERMLASAELSAAPDLIVKALGALASAHNVKREFDRALTCLLRMQGLAENYHLKPGAAFASRYLGSAYLNLNQLDDSLREYSSALGKAYQLMNEEVIVNTLSGIGLVMERLGRAREAQHFYRESVRRLDGFVAEGTLQAAPAIQANRTNLLYRQGSLALQLGDLDTAESYYKESLVPVVGKMRELEARSRIGLAQIYIEKRAYKSAEDELAASIALISSERFPELEWQAHHLKASICRVTGDVAGALRHYELAIQILEEMRKGISSLEFRRAFLTHRFDPYPGVVSLLYHEKKDLLTAFDFVDRAKSITLREYLGEHNDRLGSDQQISAWPTNSSRPAVPKGVLGLEYFLTPEELFVFIFSLDGLEAVSLPASRQQLESQIGKYLESIKRNDTDSIAALSRQLYDTLIEPVWARMVTQGADTLVIFPDGPLHTLPFGSLRDAAGHYLIERYPLAYAPSRSVFQYCLALNRTQAVSRDSSILLLDGSASLPGAASELARLSRLFGKQAVLSGIEDAHSLNKSTNGFDFIHFSGHGKNRNGRPGLVFPTPGGEAFLEASEISRWQLGKAHLVSLAGCSTGTGPREEGETPWGLLPGFFAAGAPAILVSLLPVDDASTAELTVHFFELLLDHSMSRAKALQQAQLFLLRDPGSKTKSSPGFWAPLVLVGDPR